MPAHQSAYRMHHSTETALFKVYDDLLKAIDNGQMSALMFARSNSGIWYGGSWTAIGTTGTIFGYAGPGTRLVQIILNCPYILSDLRRSFVFHQAGDLLRSTGIRLRSAIVFFYYTRPILQTWQPSMVWCYMHSPTTHSSMSTANLTTWQHRGMCWNVAYRT